MGEQLGGVAPSHVASEVGLAGDPLHLTPMSLRQFSYSVVSFNRLHSYGLVETDSTRSFSS